MHDLLECIAGVEYQKCLNAGILRQCSSRSILRQASRLAAAGKHQMHWAQGCGTITPSAAEMHQDVVHAPVCAHVGRGQWLHPKIRPLQAPHCLLPPACLHSIALPRITYQEVMLGWFGVRTSQGQCVNDVASRGPQKNEERRPPTQQKHTHGTQGNATSNKAAETNALTRVIPNSSRN